jgi:hypothetical protein
MTKIQVIVEKQFKRVMQKLKPYGDNCMGCGKLYLGGMSTLTGQDIKGRWLNVGHVCCGHRLVSVVAHGMFWPKTLEHTSAWGGAWSNRAMKASKRCAA